MKRLDYKTYLDKVYGCFLGKTVIGTIGAPFEGIKMPMELEFRPEMVDAMLPNDDLDLQVLWLDVAERCGKDFTSYDLLKSFCENCDYSPGEYATMRKNYHRGIYPPTSGRFSNDFYLEGMGCAIRSEIWACLSPLDPAHAADLSTRDAVLDHAGESVESERFFAALESAAFFESDLKKLIEIGLTQVSADCKFRRLVTDTVALCDQYADGKVVLRKILFTYGHPDCTNLFQNVAITLIALLKGNMDIIKIGMDALNCGFDTDCTCATAGAIVGLIKGAEALIKEYGFGDTRYVLSVRCERRSDSVKDLSEDIALLGCEWNKGAIDGAPETKFSFAPSSYPLQIRALYADDEPVMHPGKPCPVTLVMKNLSPDPVSADFSLKGLQTDESFSLFIPAGEERQFRFVARCDGEEVIFDTNRYTLSYQYKGEEKSFVFGVAGAMPWRVIGPIWRTDPICTTALLEQNNREYRRITHAVPYDGDRKDVSRRFHLNFAIDTDTEYLSHDACFAPLGEDAPYEDTVFWQEHDSFTMDDLFGFQGPCVAYLARELVVAEDMELCVQIGHSAPFSFYINGELIARRDNCDTWDAENVHVQHVKLHKGVNRILWRLTRANADAKFNLILSDGPSCATHYVCFGARVM